LNAVTPNDSGVVKQLLAILPPHCVITDPRAKKPFETDGLTAVRQMPWVVVLPETVEQVRSVLRVCRESRVPLVPRGAGTGLSGGARPSSDGVLLGLSKLSRIIEIDPENRVARVEPGVRNLAISEAAARYGLYYAPDPSSQIACSIGGNVAENSGGVHCLKYGLTVHNVLGLKLLTIEGDELTIGGATLDSPGYDLLALFTGSEGMLGIVTEVTVRLLPVPATKRLILAAFCEPGSGRRHGRSDHRERHHSGGTRNDGCARDRGGRGVRRRRLSDRRRGDPAVRTGRHARRSGRTGRAGWCASCAPNRRPKCVRRATMQTESGCGSDARRRSRRWDGWRQTTTAWTARSRARASPRCCAP
jgi:hypothetical protein